MMDVGQVTFANGVGPDLAHGMGFKSRKMYCVTPIVGPGGPPSTGNYDFWAVGVDCCSDSRHDFHCGEYNNPSAHSGLRMVDEDQVPFFRLAIQQAEAAYNLKAPHPVMLMWLQDPLQELNAIHAAGMNYFITGLYGHLIFQLVVVVVSVFTLTKVGRQLAVGSLGAAKPPPA